MLFSGLDLTTLISRVIVLLTAFSVHEFAHAWSADRFGDDTPRMFGRLTLNPAAHLDPIGSLMLLLAGFGWAKPVPVNPYVLGRRSPAALMWVSLAGPASNFLMAVLGAVFFRLGLMSVSLTNMNTIPTMLSIVMSFLGEFITINLLLMLFNLIPLAPLDGDKIFDYFLPANWARAWSTIRPYGPFLLLGVTFLGRSFGFDILGSILGPPMNFFVSLLLGI